MNLQRQNSSCRYAPTMCKRYLKLPKLEMDRDGLCWMSRTKESWRMFLALLISGNVCYYNSKWHAHTGGVVELYDQETGIRRATWFVMLVFESVIACIYKQPNWGYSCSFYADAFGMKFNLTMRRIYGNILMVKILRKPSDCSIHDGWINKSGFVGIRTLIIKPPWKSGGADSTTAVK